MRTGLRSCIGVLLIAGVMSSAGEALCQERIAEPQEIASIYFSVSRERGQINSYLMFLDSRGRQCSTNGKLIISRKRTDYVRKPASVEYGGISEEKMVPLVCVEHLRNIEFSPADFEFLRTDQDDLLYVLPLQLNWNELKAGEKVLVEWRDFKAEQEAPLGSP